MAHCLTCQYPSTPNQLSLGGEVDESKMVTSSSSSSFLLCVCERERDREVLHLENSHKLICEPKVGILEVHMNMLFMIKVKEARACCPITMLGLLVTGSNTDEVDSSYHVCINMSVERGII